MPVTPTPQDREKALAIPLPGCWCPVAPDGKLVPSPGNECTAHFNVIEALATARETGRCRECLDAHPRLVAHEFAKALVAIREESYRLDGCRCESGQHNCILHLTFTEPDPQDHLDAARAIRARETA